MVEVDSLDAVGRALDQVEARGFPVSSTLGRHTNDKMISFYVRAPGGFDIEYGTDGHTRRRDLLHGRRNHRGQLLGPRMVVGQGDEGSSSS